jgi:hypothetical protein
MKKLLLFLALSAMSLAVFAGGEGNRDVSVTVNGGTKTFYKIGSQNWTGNTLTADLNSATDFNGKDFGAATSFVLNGCALVSWGGQTEFVYRLRYRVYLASATAPAWDAANEFPVDSLAGTKGTDNFRYEPLRANSNKDIISKATAGNGIYKLGVQLSVNGSWGTELTATFTYTDPSALQGSFTTDSKIIQSIGMTGISYTFVSTSLNADSYSWQIDGVAAGTVNNNLTQSFTTAGAHIVKIIATKGINTNSMEKTIKVFEQSAVNEKIVGGNMTDATKWVMVKLNNTQPTLTWNSANAPTGATTALQIQKLGNPDRFAIYQPVYLTAGKKYVFDALVKDILKSIATDVNLNLQLYISNTVLPTDTSDPYDGSGNDAGTLGQLTTWTPNVNKFTNIDGSFKASAIKGSAVTGDVCSFTPLADGMYFVVLRFTTWYSSGFNLAISNLSLLDSSLATTVPNINNDNINVRSFENQIFVVGAKQSVELFSITGSKVMSQTANAETILNTSSLNNGAYVLVVDKKHSYKIIK